MRDSEELPCLRHVDGFPIDMDGRQMICLRDPEGYAGDPVVLTGEAFFIASLLDGQHDVRDIQAACFKRFSQLVYTETIEQLIDTLDKAYLLENDRFAERCVSVLEEFRRQPVRPASHAGQSYPVDPAELRSQLDSFFIADDGPGMPGEPGRKPCVCAAIAPHIDLERGGVCYAYAYKELIERCPAETFIVFGTCHPIIDQPFALTKKDFATPLGDLATDGDLVDRIADSVGSELFDNELAHRSEHTIEFQALFIQHAFGGRRPVRIVPVLCGTYPGLVDDTEDSPQAVLAQHTLDTISQIIRDMGDAVAVIASADLSHVGPRFGDQQPVSQFTLASLKSTDLVTLKTVEAADTDPFMADVKRDGNRRHICGIPPIHALLSVVPRCEGRLLRYDQWPDPNATVTFASVVFDRSG